MGEWLLEPSQGSWQLVPDSGSLGFEDIKDQLVGAYIYIYIHTHSYDLSCMDHMEVPKNGGYPRYHPFLEDVP